MNAENLPMRSPTLADQIDALLPQTQCTRCGYDGCRPYAQAIAVGAAPINRCPPGGESGIMALAALLNTPALPLDPATGESGPLHVAVIDEDHCIGCTLCLRACPVDAIVGARKHMHTVLNDWCTGCALCVAPCPVDCIAMVPAERCWTTEDTSTAREHHRHRLARLQRESAGNASLMATEVPLSPPPHAASEPAARKRALIESALAKARARRGGSRP